MMEPVAYTIFDVSVLFSKGRYAQCAYNGSDRKTAEAVTAQLRQRTDIIRLCVRETHITVQTHISLREDHGGVRRV